MRVHLYHGNTMYDILAEKTTTLKDILQQCELSEDLVLFTAPPSEPNKTPIVDLDKTLVDYNMWFPEKSYVAELTAYTKTDNYNKELYEMYLEIAKKLK